MDAQPSAGSVLYLYGVMARSRVLPAGIHAGVEWAAAGRLAAIVEPVSAAEFSPDALERRMQSTEWVASMAAKHETVLEEAMAHGAVVPARLCTLYSRAEAVTEYLADNQARLLAVLRRIEGRHEYAVKVFADEKGLHAAAAGDPEIRMLDEAIARATPGQAYLLARKREARCAGIAEACVDRSLEEAMAVLEAPAVEMRLRDLLSEAATGRTERMVLNLALLVEHDDVTVHGIGPAFLAAVERARLDLQRVGLALEMTGPWPPYSFCDDGGPVDADGGDGPAAAE